MSGVYATEERFREVFNRIEAYIENFWRSGMPAVQPLSIPTFQPARWVSRADGVVI